MNKNNQQTQFGLEVLGPLIERFCYKLWLGEKYHHENNTVVLFLARGGLRIRLYYKLFLTKYNLSSRLVHNDLLVSRLAVHKAALICNEESSIESIAQEFAWSSVLESIQAIFGTQTTREWLNLLTQDEIEAFGQEYMSSSKLRTILDNQSKPNSVLVKHLNDHFNMFHKHVDQQTLGRKNLLLVDTGWSGSIIRSIKTLLPEKNILACFYGKYSYGKPITKGWYNDILGLEAEGIKYQRTKPGSSIFLHRHLLEGLCEVNWPSVTGYKETEIGQIVSSQGPFKETLRSPQLDDKLGQGVIQYLKQKRSHESYVCLDAGRAAVTKLNRAIIFPNHLMTSLTFDSRSADFGKNLEVPVLLPPARPYQIRRKIANIKDSLWTSAQITKEFPMIYPVLQLIYYLKIGKA